MLAALWDYVVRLRTWIANLFFVVLLFIPDVLNTPEILAVIPAGYTKYVVAAAFLVNIWLRPRPAARAVDKQ